MTLESAVGRIEGREKASIGAAFRPISWTAPQFQIIDLALPQMLFDDNVLASFESVNCVF
jgi:hypothetical protein